MLSDLPKMGWKEMRQVRDCYFHNEPGYHDVKDESDFQKFLKECILRNQVSCPLDEVRNVILVLSPSDINCLL